MDSLRYVSFNPKLFLLSLLVLVLSYSLLPLIWLAVGRAFGIPLNLKEAVSSWFISSIGRYIPGKVWQFVGRASLLPYSSTLVVSAMFYEHLILMAGASLFSFVFFRYPTLQILLSSMLIAALILWRWSVGLISKRFPKVRHYPSRPVFIVVALVLSTLYWSISGFGAYLVAKSIGWERGYQEVAFAYSFSFVASYVLPLTPAGLGIREAILSTVMGYSAQSSIFALLTRIAIVVADLLALGVGVSANLTKSNPSEPSEDRPL